MRSTYRLAARAAGFDFFPWLVMQKARGATEIALDLRTPKTDKWPIDKVQRRIESILIPGPALAGLPCVIAKGGDEISPGSQRALVDACKDGLDIPRLRSVLPAGKEKKYTVTLRRTQRIPERNSDERAWRDFAAEIGAVVIPDFEDEPIHLHDRMALYAGAEMNFFVTNGPVMLCFLSEYPAMGFDVNMSPMTNLGIPRGEPYPFLLPQHRQIYETPSAEVLRRHFEAWLRERG